MYVSGITCELLMCCKPFIKFVNDCNYDYVTLCCQYSILCAIGFSNCDNEN